MKNEYRKSANRKLILFDVVYICYLYCIYNHVYKSIKRRQNKDYSDYFTAFDQS
jgi:hypothetical protein